MDIEENKMKISDTPISDSTPHNVAELGMLCMKLERITVVRLAYITQLTRKVGKLEDEINAANDSIRVLKEQNEYLNERHVMFVKELKHSDKKYMNTLTDLVNAMDRIQQLEEAGDALLNANNDDEEYKAIKHWNKSKEAKP